MITVQSLSPKLLAAMRNPGGPLESGRRRVRALSASDDSAEVTPRVE